MKHAIPLFTFTFCLHLSLLAAVPLRWTVETSRATPATFEAYQGETIYFEADLQSVGKPLEMSGLAEFFWQTNGMGSAYWETTAAVNSNRLSAVFTPEMDVGARVYNCFIGVPGTIYHAAFQLRLRPSPGAIPNVLPLPVPVIDFAKVRVLNPPWSGGGGGGVDTNAVIDIIHETVSGSARSLPKYLHERYFDDSYPNEAQEYYRSRGNGKTEGGCSSVRDGGFLYRNFDYPFDDRAEFVVHMSSGPARFASVGIAQVGTNLTEQFVTSGKPSRWYKALPGATEDGINENGVSCEINVVGGAPAWDGGASPALHPLAAVRWVLDNATNALQASTYIASHIAFPQGWTQNFHYMIADETSTYIVENGTAYPSGGTGVSPVSVLTNFRLYPTRDTTGEGQERYDALASGANITSQWWTLTYTPTGYRASDLPGITGEALTQLFNYWGNNPRESRRGERFGTMTWWQTVHTSIYDITNRVLRIAVQETDDWYVFAIPGGTGVSPVQVRAIAAEVVAPVASDLEMKIDRNGDTMNGNLGMDYNDLSDVGYMNVGSLTVEDDLDVESADVHFGGAMTVDGKSTLGEVSAEQIDATHLVASGTVKAGSGLQVGQTDVMQELGGKIGKVASATNGNFAVFSNGSVTDGGLSPGDVTGAIAGKRDVDDLLVYGLSADYASVTFEVTSDREIIAGTYTTDDGVLWVNFETTARIRRSGTVFTLSDEFEEIISTSWTGVPATGAIRIGTTTVSFGVNAYHDRIAKKSMISATDPTFSNAVLAVGLNIDTNSVAVLNEIAATFGDFPITGTATTVGGLLAALAAAVAWLRKRAAHLESDGTADDTFATDLLGKPVGNAKVRYALATTASVAMADRTVNLYEMNGNGTITFPTATTHEGVTYARDFLLRVKVTTAGSLTLPTDVTPLGDSFDFTKVNDWLIAFTEIGKDANNKAEFYIRAISLEV